MEKEKTLYIRQDESKILLLTDDNCENIEVLYALKTIWMTQRSISEYFGVPLSRVAYHFRKLLAMQIFDEAQCRRPFRSVSQEGTHVVVRRQAFFRIDIIIALAFYFSTKKSIQFVRFATGVVSDLILQGFVIDSQRLDNGPLLNENFWKKLNKELPKNIVKDN